MFDDSFLLLFNGHHQAVHFTVTGSVPDARWRVLIDTRKLRPRAARRRFVAGERVRVEARCVVILANSASRPEPTEQKPSEPSDPSER